MRRPTVRNGCGSVRELCERPDRMISISVSGRAVGCPPKPTSRTTLGICSTRSRSRSASRTNTYPGNKGSSNCTRRSFHVRTELYSGRKCSTSRIPSSAATRFSCCARVYAAYQCSSAQTVGSAFAPAKSAALFAAIVEVEDAISRLQIQLRPVTHRATYDLTLYTSATYSQLYSFNDLSEDRKSVV